MTGSSRTRRALSDSPPGSKVNLFHRWYCASGCWARTVRGELVPWALSGVDLTGHVLEVGPGPGLTTALLAPRAARLTAVEVDPELAQRLRMQVPANVDVVTADATKLPFPDAYFDAAVCFTMLHHVPSPQLQDRLLSEVRRVLQPGGVFAGSDSTAGPLFRIAHAFDTMLLVDPETFAHRLRVAGFVDTHAQRGRRAFRFQARCPTDGIR